LHHRHAALSWNLAMVVAIVALAARAGFAADEKAPSLGPNAPLNGWRPMSAGSEWNRRIDEEPADPNSRELLAAIRHTSGQFAGHAWLHPDFGPEGGIPYVVVDRGRNKLFELFAARVEGRAWRAGSGAVFDLAGDDRQRPDGWTSADAAGLPIFPGLAKFDEVASGEIRHALRFTAPKTRKAYVFPASHYASPHTEAGLPPMGMRIRLKKSFDTRPYAPAARTILRCLQTYGAILADNGGPFFINGAPHPKWDTEELAQIKRVRDELLLDSLEVVRIDPQRLVKGGG
jgi:hypothetical protein